MPSAAGVSKPSEVTSKDKIRLPVWGWALLGGVTLVVGWRFYQARKANSAAAASPVSADTSGNIPTTILGPSDNGEDRELSGQEAILQAIKDLQGAPSTAVATPDLGSLTTLEVRAGDSLGGKTWADIAKRYGISEQHLKNFNADSANRGHLGPIDVNKALIPGMEVAVPWQNK